MSDEAAALAEDRGAGEQGRVARADEQTARLHRWAEIVAVVLLALAALLTAWSGYEAARWGGDQSLRFGEASARRVDSVRAAARAD
jgi:hypothetical protein